MADALPPLPAALPPTRKELEARPPKCFETIGPQDAVELALNLFATQGASLGERTESLCLSPDVQTYPGFGFPKEREFEVIPWCAAMMPRTAGSCAPTEAFTRLELLRGNREAGAAPFVRTDWSDATEAARLLFTSLVQNTRNKGFGPQNRFVVYRRPLEYGINTRYARVVFYFCVFPVPVGKTNAFIHLQQIFRKLSEADAATMRAIEASAACREALLI